MKLQPNQLVHRTRYRALARAERAGDRRRWASQVTMGVELSHVKV